MLGDKAHQAAGEDRDEGHLDESDEVLPSPLEDGVQPAVAADLALQLRLPFQVGLVGFGLVAAAPDGPCDDESGLDPALG